MPDMDGFETAALIRSRKQIGAHADHLRHRLHRRDAHGPGLLAGRGRLHPLAGRAGDPAHQGRRLRRPVPEDAAGASGRPRSASRWRGSRRPGRPPRRRPGARPSWPRPARVLASSLDYEATVASLLRLVVPYLADLAAVTLVGEHAQSTRTEWAWVCLPENSVKYGSAAAEACAASSRRRSGASLPRANRRCCTRSPSAIRALGPRAPARRKTKPTPALGGVS